MAPVTPRRYNSNNFGGEQSTNVERRYAETARQKAEREYEDVQQELEDLRQPYQKPPIFYVRAPADQRIDPGFDHAYSRDHPRGMGVEKMQKLRRYARTKQWSDYDP